MAQPTGSDWIERLEARIQLAAEPPSIQTTAFDGRPAILISGTDASDQITVRASDQGMLVDCGDGSPQLLEGAFDLIVVAAHDRDDRIQISAEIALPAILYGGEGNDTLIGGRGPDRLYGGLGDDQLFGGMGNDTLVSIGGGDNDRVSGGAGRDSFWIDAAEAEIVTDLTDEETARRALHRVEHFLNYQHTQDGELRTASVSEELAGQDLVDPALTATATDYFNFSNRPLFPTAGPGVDDVRQGLLGDCYLLASLSALAKVNPEAIRQIVVDLGDGTYAVRFRRLGRDLFVRVDADLPVTSSLRIAYADLGRDQSLWVAILEKAYAIFRKNRADYATITSGYMNEVHAALGQRSRTLYTASSAAALLASLYRELRAGRAVTFGTDEPGDAPLLRQHAYLVDRVLVRDGRLVGLRLRNPWGLDGVKNGTDPNDGYVLISARQAYASFLLATSAEA